VRKRSAQQGRCGDDRGHARHDVQLQPVEQSPAFDQLQRQPGHAVDPGIATADEHGAPTGQGRVYGHRTALHLGHHARGLHLTTGEQLAG